VAVGGAVCGIVSEHHERTGFVSRHRGVSKGANERPTSHGCRTAADVVATPRMKDALVVPRTVFRDVPGRELDLTGAAKLVEDKVCHTLLRVLCDTGVLEQRRSGMFVAVRTRFTLQRQTENTL
jgi:hypothetical protein